MEQSTHQELPLLKDLLLEKYEPIAIVGVGLRLPGGNGSSSEFASFLNGGGDGIVDIPADRWDNERFFSESATPGTIKTRKGGYLDDISGFDPKFFNISPKEAKFIDPQQRLVLEASWQALEDAYCDVEQLRDSNGGVFVGVSSIDYSLEVSALSLDEWIAPVGTGTAHSAVSGRVSYFLGWRGPCVSVDTACSSSLVALHQSVQALRRKECNIALCGGVNAIHHPRNLIVFSNANMLSPDGRCHTFDDKANGYGRSEGCCMVVLKRLSDALENNDRIIATIRGSAVNQDGESGGLTVPNGLAQEASMRNAIADSALLPEDIDYVEAHGTGTSLGDPIELTAINQVFCKSHSREKPIIVGSVKGNIGHTEAAAGIVGVVKAALQLEQQTLYAQTSMQTRSSHVNWDDYIIEVPTTSREWKTGGRQNEKRRCVVNSFGFAGTLSSVVLEEAPPPRTTCTRSDTVEDERGHTITLSAKSSSSLLLRVRDLRKWLESQTSVDLESLAYSTNLRAHFSHRISWPVNADAQALINWLNRQEQKLEKKKLPQPARTQIAFLFTGQGSQYVGMGLEQYRSSSEFRQAVDLCDQMFAVHLQTSIRNIMFGESENAEVLINETQFTQAALFTFEYAMSRYLISLGLQPSALLGHSIGEIVAACVAGVVDLLSAVQMVSARATLMQAVSTEGSMLAVSLSESDLLPYLQGNSKVGFAAINSPGQCVVSGDLDGVATLRGQLVQAGVECKALKTSHAFHSYHMAEMYDDFKDALSSINFGDSEIAVISNLYGRVATGNELASPEYWVEHVGQPVRFAEGVRALADRGQFICLEVGPTASLCSLGRQSAPEMNWVSSTQKNRAFTASIAELLSQCYDAGIQCSWKSIHQGTHLKKLDIPYYAFDKQRYWLDIDPKRRFGQSSTDGQLHPFLAEQLVEQSAETGCKLFRSEISANSPKYLTAHKVYDQVVFPGAAFVETLIAAQQRLFGETGGPISNINILEPLYLDDQTIGYQTECTLLASGCYATVIASLTPSGNGEESIRREHVHACIERPADASDRALDLVRITSDNRWRQVSADDLYPDFEQLGLAYGTEFQRLISVDTNDHDLSVATLSAGFKQQETVTPTLLDCAMQSVAVLTGGDSTYLPISFGKVTYLKQPRGELICKLKLKLNDSAAGELQVDFVILDGDRPVIVVRDLVLKRVVTSQKATPRKMTYSTKWRKLSRPVAKADEYQNILFYNFDAEWQQALTSLANDISINAEFAASSTEVRQALTSCARNDTHHIVFAWPSEATTEFVYSELLCLLRLLENEFSSVNVKLHFVTHAAQLINTDDANMERAVDGAASSLWGFVHSLMNESPRWNPVLIDLPTNETRINTASWLLAEVAHHTEAENFIAYRNGLRYVKRLVEYGTGVETASNYEVRITEYGLFENVKPVKTELLPPAAGEVQIEVRSVGLNFKDVLNALGLLKQYAEEHELDHEPLPLGFEASGEVVATGEGCLLKPGDAVMLSELGCFRKRINLPESLLVRKPTCLTHSQAAGIPTAYITAYYSLVTLGRISKGDRILIHSAAGGVGQAAVQIAKAVGAEIYATASLGKWEHLRKQGIVHLMNSRTLDFRQEILDATHEQGVDIVLNSLNKDYIPAGLDVLATQGRFIELGKIGIWSAADVAAYAPGIEYHNFDLSELPAEALRTLNSQTLQKVANEIEVGHYQPLPVTEYELGEISEAFEVLSRGANTGKLVVKLTTKSIEPNPITIEPDQLYLITGGFGALGQALLHKLVERGARQIALCGRRTPTETFMTSLAGSLPDDVTLHTYITDVENQASTVKLIDDISTASATLGGVFHTAGVLADAPVAAQSLDSINTVFAAKVRGTENLLRELDRIGNDAFFVGYSSIASILGSAGQSNYAAANAYLDHKLQVENTIGRRRCIAVNWGPWAEIGMASDLNEQQIQSIEDRGILMLSPKEGLRRLFRCFSSNVSHLAICEFDWQRYLSAMPVQPRYFHQLAIAGTGKQAALIDLDALNSQSLSEKRLGMSQFVRASIARVLHYDDVEDISPEARFADLGLDSLVAVELKNGMEAALGIQLMTSLVFDYPTIPQLTDFLSNSLWKSEADDDKPSLITGVEQLSDEELDRELLEITV